MDKTNSVKLTVGLVGVDASQVVLETGQQRRRVCLLFCRPVSSATYDAKLTLAY